MSHASREGALDARRRALRLGFGVAALLLVDQLTKLWISNRLELGESIPILPGFLHFTLVHNTGMAFGMLSNRDIPFKTLVVTVLSLLALAAVIYYALRAPSGEATTRLGLTFILAGALGNILDRARLGYVVDFVDVFYGDKHWPAFNVADASICIGVGLLLLESLRHREASVHREPEMAAGARRGES